jgi:hypothetical protein
MGSRKNPNHRNAKLSQMRNLFQGYTRDQALTDRMDYLATGESPTGTHFLTRMIQAQKDGRMQNLTDAYYRNEFYNEHRKHRWHVYPQCREADEYRKAQGRVREQDTTKDMKGRASDYVEGAKQRLLTLFTAENGEVRPWVKAIWEKVGNIYGYGNVTTDSMRETDQNYLRFDMGSDYASVSLGLQPTHAYRMLKGDPRYCRNIDDKEAYVVLWVGDPLPHGRQEACAAILFQGMPHIAGGYIYRYKKEWRFNPQRLRCIIADTPSFGARLGGKP